MTVRPRCFDHQPIVMDVLARREDGGHVITAWDRASDGCDVVCQAYMQPDGIMLFERALKVIK
jgi:hypothetical protein